MRKTYVRKGTCYYESGLDAQVVSITVTHFIFKKLYISTVFLSIVFDHFLPTIYESLA